MLLHTILLQRERCHEKKYGLVTERNSTKITILKSKLEIKNEKHKTRHGDKIIHLKTRDLQIKTQFLLDFPPLQSTSKRLLQLLMIKL